MNNFLPTGAATNRFTPSMFLTPQGNVYIIDSALEVANVPMGTGVSVAICPTENLMYLKMYQNGAPAISAYTLAPYEQPANSSNIEKVLQNITQRLEKIEKSISSKKEDKLSELLYMRKEIHEMYQDWYNNIDRKIKKY